MSRNIQFNFLKEMSKPSKSQVKKAGDNLRSDPDNIEAHDILNRWRAFHIYPLNTFQTTLKSRLTKSDIECIVTAQRLKRTPTIIDKLSRQPKMQLDRMQDIGGLRAVLKDIDAVRKLEEIYSEDHSQASSKSKGVFRHIIKNKSDYINNPKESGYRGIHIIYKTVYEPKNEYSDLLIELQIRSRLQHVWATAVETIGTYLGQGFKFSKGEESWKNFFALVSSAFALIEKSNVLEAHKELSKDALYEKIREEYNSLNVDNILQGLVISTQNITSDKSRGSFYCLIKLDALKKSVSISKFPKNKLDEANEALLESEKNKNIQSVLVAINNVKKLEKAYPNYFLDAVDFLNLLKEIIKPPASTPSQKR